MTNIVIPVPAKLVQVKDHVVDATHSVQEAVKSRVSHVQRAGQRLSRIGGAIKEALKTK